MDDQIQEIDRALIKNIIVVVIIIMVFFGGAIYFYHNQKLAPFRKQCEENPGLRYTEACQTMKDCIDKCAKREFARANP